MSKELFAFTAKFIIFAYGIPLAIYGCVLAGSAKTLDQHLDDGDSVLAHVHYGRPRNWDNRCKIEIEFVGGGHLSAKTC